MVKKTILLTIFLCLTVSVTSFAAIVYENNYEDQTVGAGFPAWNWVNGAMTSTVQYASYEGNIVVEMNGSVNNTGASSSNCRMGTNFGITVSGNTSTNPADYWIAFDIKNVSGGWDPIPVELWVLPGGTGHGTGVSRYAISDGWVRVVANLGDMTANWWNGANWNSISGASWTLELGMPYPGEPIAAGVSFNQVLLIDNLIITMGEEPPLPVTVKGIATKPIPANKKDEISIDLGAISWTTGEYVEAQNGTHNVFFGTDEASVTNATIDNPMGTTLFQGLAKDSNNVALDRLEYATTYFWRVDEVNNPASTGTVKGNIWYFKTELKGYPILPASIINVTSYGDVYPDEPDRQDPNSTCTGAGLDANDMHGIDMKTMWLGMDEGAYLQYEFDKAYRLYDMLVWNYNEEAPNNEYFGAKDVKVEYSLDGENWTEVTDVPEFAMATGSDECIANTTVMLGGTAAKYVKLTFLTGWGDMGLYGISEVRFSAEPTRAQTPDPEDEDTGISVRPVLSWKPGRYSVDHNVYISTDVNAVTEGTADMVTRSDANFAPDIALAKTYYWRVDEVNNAEAYPVWDGPTWSFSTAQYIAIDNFEVGYGNTEVNFVWATWKDGVEVSANGGSEIGKDIDPPGLANLNRSGTGHSIKVNFDNTTGKTLSQVAAQSVLLPIKTTDWSIGSPSTLTIWFRGDPNTVVGDSEMYCTIGGKTDTYKGSISALKLDRWYQWDIDLVALGADLSNISNITIGIRTKTGGTTGATGVIYFDDIRLTGLVSTVPGSEILIEAEAYKTISEPLQVRDTVAGALGGKYIQVLEGTASASNNPPTTGIATYQVNITGGKYVIYGRVSIPTTNQDAFWVRIQGATSDRTLHTSGWCQWNTIPAGAAWHWDDVHSSSNNGLVVTWTMPAGAYTIEVAYRDSDAANPPRLDALLIVKTGD